MSYAGTRRSTRHSTASQDEPADPYSFSAVSAAARRSNRSGPSHVPAPAPLPPPPPPFSSSAPTALFVHDAVSNFILTPLTPGIPVDLRSRQQSELDQLTSDVFLYCLHRQAALLPVRLAEVNAKVLKKVAGRGVAGVLLKDVRRRLRIILGWRLEEVKKPQTESDHANKAGDRRGRMRAAKAKAAPAPVAADVFIITADPSAGEDPTLTRDTCPLPQLMSERAHSALLKVVLDCVSWHHPDGVCAEHALLGYLAPLFATTVAKLALMEYHVLFRSVLHLLSVVWVEQGYLERFTLKDVESLGMYGARREDNEQPHYSVGPRARAELSLERRYRWSMLHVMEHAQPSEEVCERLRKKEQGAAGGGQPSDGKAADQPGERDDVKNGGGGGFSLSQGLPARGRSAEPVPLPREQQTQLLSPKHQAMARYLVHHPCIAESHLLAYYREVTEERSPALEPLLSALNGALNWTSLFVQRTPCEYTGEELWLLVDRSTLEAHGFFAAYTDDEVGFLRALIAELRRKEDVDGHAKATLAQAHRVARRYAVTESVKGERRRRMLDGLDASVHRLALDGWLYAHSSAGSLGAYSIGMRAYAELCRPSASAPAFPVCPTCRLPVYYGLWCGRHQDSDEGCRVKYHVHCVRKIRARTGGGVMRCSLGHVWGREKATEDDFEEQRQRDAGETHVSDAEDDEDNAAPEGRKPSSKRRQQRGDGEEGEDGAAPADEEEEQEREQAGGDGDDGEHMPTRRSTRGMKRALVEDDEGDAESQDHAAKVEHTADDDEGASLHGNPRAQRRRRSGRR